MLHKVCTALKNYAAAAQVESDHHIEMPTDCGFWAIGNCNEKWSGHFCQPDGDFGGHDFELPFSCDHESDGVDIAHAIERAIDEILIRTNQ